jgi:hypothetical protein
MILLYDVIVFDSGLVRFFEPDSGLMHFMVSGSGLFIGFESRSNQG